MYGERIPPLAALDIDRADHGVVFGRPDALQRHHMLAGEVVHQRVVAVVGDEAGERIVGLQLKRLPLRHPAATGSSSQSKAYLLGISPRLIVCIASSPLICGLQWWRRSPKRGNHA